MKPSSLASQLLSKVKRSKSKTPIAQGVRKAGQPFQALQEQVEEHDGILEEILENLGLDDEYGVKRIYGLGQETDTGSGVTFDKSDLPSFENAWLYMEASKRAQITELKVNNDPINIGDGIPVVALDPTSGQRVAGFPLGSYKGTSGRIYIAAAVTGATTDYVTAWIVERTNKLSS